MKLGAQKRLRVTPGSLSGGGAVALRRQGLPLSDLQWKMRLQGQQSLAYYLQEVLADSILPLPSHEARENIRTAAHMLSVFCAAQPSAPRAQLAAPFAVAR